MNFRHFESDTQRNGTLIGDVNFPMTKINMNFIRELGTQSMRSTYVRQVNTNKNISLKIIQVGCVDVCSRQHIAIVRIR